MKPILVIAVAQAEIDRAAGWYENRKEGLGAEFLDRVSETLERIEMNPQVYAEGDRGLQLGRCLSSRAPATVLPPLSGPCFFNPVQIISRTLPCASRFGYPHAHRAAGKNLKDENRIDARVSRTHRLVQTSVGADIGWCRHRLVQTSAGVDIGWCRLK